MGCGCGKKKQVVMSPQQAEKAAGGQADQATNESKDNEK